MTQADKCFALKYWLPLMISLMITQGCAYIKPAKSELETTVFHAASDSQQLIVLLPGLGMDVEDYQSQGVIEKIRACNRDAEIIAADAYLAYYRNEETDIRLYEDVIKPAQVRGKTKIWLVGTSLGGLGSLIYRLSRPQDLQGIVIMAPYLGKEEDLKLYLNAQVKGDEIDPESIQNPVFLELWQSLEQTGKAQPEIVMGYGQQDKFAYLQDWAAGQLPQDKVVVTEGEHKWVVWNTIWAETLGRSNLCVSQ